MEVNGLEGMNPGGRTRSNRSLPGHLETVQSSYEEPDFLSENEEIDSKKMAPRGRAFQQVCRKLCGCAFAFFDEPNRRLYRRGKSKEAKLT